MPYPITTSASDIHFYLINAILSASFILAFLSFEWRASAPPVWYVLPFLILYVPMVYTVIPCLGSYSDSHPAVELFPVAFAPKNVM